MGIIWFDGQPKEIVVTINELNLTINKSGVQFLKNANQVMLGFDEENAKVFIKPLSKDEVLRGDIANHMRYNISVTQSYGRVANKAYVTKLDKTFSLGLDERGLKFKARWLKNQGMIEVDLKEVLSHD